MAKETKLQHSSEQNSNNQQNTPEAKNPDPTCTQPYQVMPMAEGWREDGTVGWWDSARYNTAVMMLWYFQDRRKVHARAAIREEASDCVGTGYPREAKLSFSGSTWRKSRYLFLLVHLVGLGEEETTFYKSNDFFSNDSFKRQVLALNEVKRHECTLTSTNDALKEIYLWDEINSHSSWQASGDVRSDWRGWETLVKGLVEGGEILYIIYCEEHVIQSANVSPIKYI